ncbi:hypothetical protein AVEN_171688-1 [Araneus ventricosus]|uniref:Uncharacterized protein n=1 Tax=Araneus ventricosus TaxID=182803 RepID=A0A4Y2RRV7_ARAVE|nr:hypothetical protein AVEN_171688-1 [Araneus ventricosus]
MDKNDPKSFNILSGDNEANLEILSENEMYPHSLSNCLSTANRDKKSGDDDFNNLSSSSDNPSSNNLASNFVRDSSNLGTSPCSNSFESYHSPNSSSPGSSPKDSANYSPQHIENNTTVLNSYVNFTHENESNESSTVDASCLGLASASIYKKHQLENEPKTSVAENISQAALNYNGNQNSYSSFSKLNSRTQAFSRNQPKIRDSSSDNLLMQDQFPHQETSRGKPDSANLAFQGMQAPLVNLEPSKSQLSYSYSSHQFMQGQIESQSSKTQSRNSALSSEQEVQHKRQDLEHSEKQSRCSPPFLSIERAQGQGNIETQPSCSPVFNASQEIGGLEHSRSHQTCSSFNSFTLLQGQRVTDQEAVNSEVQNFSSQQEVESHDSVKNHQRSSPVVSFSQEMQRQISGNHQARSPTFDMQQEVQTHLSVIQEHGKIQSKHQTLLLSDIVKAGYFRISSFPPAALKDQDSAESQQRHSLNSSHDENQKQKPVKSQLKNSNISYQNQQVSDQMKFTSHQEVENGENNRNQPMVSATSCADQQLNNQNSLKNYSMYWDQNFAGSQPRDSPTLSAHQEMTHQQTAVNQPRYSPTVSVHQEMNHHQPRYSPTVSSHQEMNHQQPAKNQPRYSPNLSVNQEMNQQQAKNQPRCSPSLSAHQEMSHHQTAENQPRCPPNASAQQTDDKKSAKVQGNSAFLKSQIIAEQESVGCQSSYSPAFSNQGVLVQESAKSSVQHMHNESPSMQNQIPIEAPPFDFGNIFSNSFSSANATAQVNEPPFTANSAMQVPSQVPMSHFNQNHMTRSSFPTMKVRLPPSTGELIVVPGDPSSMTFHLLAKPLSDPSHPIQSSVEIHANNQLRNRDYQENSNDESASARNKNPAKQDTTRAPLRKQSSPILELQQLALNPIRSSTLSSSQKNKNCDNRSHSNRSAEPSLKSPPAIASDFSIIKPNAVLVRPLESSATSVQQQQHARNSNSFQQGAFVQQTEGPRTVIFPKGNRMTNVVGSSSISTNSMSINVNNGQRPIIPNNLPNTVMQNGSGQYVFVPSKDILQSNVDQNLKVKNSERPPQFYPSNMMQGFPFQNGQMNPVQVLPQVHLPYVNPYYIVTNPSAFQNASRYPVMSMQPIPFQNR